MDKIDRNIALYELMLARRDIPDLEKVRIEKRLVKLRKKRKKKKKEQKRVLKKIFEDSD